MSTNAKMIKPVTGSSSLVRPRFSPGLLLRDDDLNQSVDYTRDLSRLLFRSLFGCGVVCGMKVSSEFKCDKLIVTVADGAALDCRGDPIHVPSPQPIPIDPTCGDPISDDLWVMIRRTEKCCAPRSAVCSCDDENPAVCTRERDGYEIRILGGPPECACGCHEKDKSTDQPETEVPAAKAKANSSAKNPEKPEHDCWCVDPTSECYADHYAGVCSCDCCDREWVVLARLKRDKSDSESRKWNADHSVRRFVRPVLMRDPQVEIEKKARQEQKDKSYSEYKSAPAEAEPPSKASRRARSRT